MSSSPSSSSSPLRASSAASSATTNMDPNKKPTSFANPYEGLPDAVVNQPNPPGVVHQTAVRISGYDRALMLSVHNGRPTIQTTIAILVRNLCYELRKAGITEYNPALYERVVGGLSVVLGPADDSGPRKRGTDSDGEPFRSSPSGDDGRGTERVARTTDSPPAVAPDASESRPRTRRQSAKRSGTT